MLTKLALEEYRHQAAKLDTRLGESSKQAGQELVNNCSRAELRTAEHLYSFFTRPRPHQTKGTNPATVSISYCYRKPTLLASCRPGCGERI